MFRKLLQNTSGQQKAMSRIQDNNFLFIMSEPYYLIWKRVFLKRLLFRKDQSYLTHKIDQCKFQRCKKRPKTAQIHISRRYTLKSCINSLKKLLTPWEAQLIGRRNHRTRDFSLQVMTLTFLITNRVTNWPIKWRLLKKTWLHQVTV